MGISFLMACIIAFANADARIGDTPASSRDSLSSTSEEPAPLVLELAIDPGQNLTESSKPQIRRSSMYCYEFCDDFSCEGDNSSYAKCTQCKQTGYAQDFGDGRVWCTRQCPTGFADNRESYCHAPDATNLSSWTFTTAGPWENDYAIIKGENYSHSTDRGVYFNGSSSFFTFEDTKFPIHFTISGWVYLLSNISDQILFTKQEAQGLYRPYYSVFVRSAGHLSCEMMNPSFSHSGVFEDLDSNQNANIFPLNSWEYWAVSVKMNDDAVHSTVRFIKGVTSTQSDQIADSQGKIYFIDETETNGTWVSDGGTSFLGASHNEGNATPDSKYLFGFMYNFHIDRGFYAKGAEQLHYGNTGCIGCRLGDVCTHIPTQCLPAAGLTSYNLVHQSSTSRQLASSCFEHCQTCDSNSNIGNYSNCTACKSTHWAQVFNGNYVYCTDYCPTGFIDNQPECVAPITTNLFSWTLTSTAGLTSNGHTLTPTGISTSPARGLYFPGAPNNYVDMGTLQFSINFTFSEWMYMFDISGWSVVFGKDDMDTSSSTTYFRINARPDKKLQIQQCWNVCDSLIDVGIFPLNSWEYWVISMRMNTDAVSSDWRILKAVSGTTQQQTTNDNLKWFDRGGKTTMGARYYTDRTINSTNVLWGFVYNFHLDHGFYDTIHADLHYGNSGCHSDCRDGVCTTDPLECLETIYDYDCSIYDGGESDCYWCYDPMCMACGGNLGTTDCTMCHDFASLENGECTCATARDTKIVGCFDQGCPAFCASCLSDNSPYHEVIAYCTSCQSGYADLSNDSSYVYCVMDCPTGFATETVLVFRECEQEDELILSYNFDHPNVTFFDNQVTTYSSFIAFAWILSPAVHRGYYFYMSNQFMMVNNLVLNHSLSIHSWIMIMTLPNTGETDIVFGKDRGTENGFGDPSDHYLINFGFNSSGQLTVEWARDHSRNFTMVALDVNVPTVKWRYVVYSLEYFVNTTSDPKTQYTQIRGYVGEPNLTEGDMQQSAAVDLQNYFMRDQTSYQALIGNAPGNNQTQAMTGFMYDFHLYQVKYTPGTNGQYGTGLGCYEGPSATSCWEVDQDQYSADGTTSAACDSNSCGTRGCKDGLTCRANCSSDGGYEYCNLCLNGGCISCPTYDTCTLCKSSTGTFAPTDNLCCFEHCATCVSSDNADYSECTSCKATHWAQTFNTDRTYCADYCPTGFTDAQPTCTAPSATNIVSWTFTSTAGLTSNGHTVTATGTSPSPARGFYFEDETTYLTTSVIRVSINFTVSQWVFRLPNNGNSMTFFSKFDTDTMQKYLRIKTGTDGILFVNTKYDGIGPKVFDTEEFPSNAWEYLRVSIKMNDDALTSDIRIIKAVAATEETFTGTDSGSQFLDRGGVAQLGVGMASDSSIASPLWGFIYNFHIDHGYYTASDSTLYYGNSGCSSACIDDVCTTVSTECLEYVWQYDCEIDGGDAHCWQCYDALCMSCSGLGIAECDMCHDFATVSSGECVSPESRDSPLERSFDCPGECATCDSTNSPYNDNIAYCTACLFSKYNISGDANYQYCIDRCPTAFNLSSGLSDCSLDSGLILSYDLNIPRSTWINSVSGGVETSLTASGTSGAPAMHRGYHVPDTDAQITLSAYLVLYHTFSVHAWILLNTLGDNTVFSKDKYDYTDSDKVSEKLLWWGVDANGYMSVSFVKDKSPNVQVRTLDNSPVGANNWAYLAFSFENVVNTGVTPYTQYTELVGFVNNQATSSVQLTKFFLNDKSDYDFWAASARMSTTTYEKPLQGFLYEFYVYQTKHTTAITDHYSTGEGCFDATSLTNCWTVAFGRHTSDGSTDDGPCDASCGSRGCRDSSACIAACDTGDQAYCNLCADKLCTLCATYDTCESGYCKTNAEDYMNGCQCSTGVRVSLSPPEEVCNNCYAECLSCTSGDSYETCTQCQSGSHYAQLFNSGNNVYCTDYCPFGFTQGTAPQCDEPSSITIASFTFTSNGPWASGLSQIEEDDNTPTKTISPLRGYYFGNLTSYLWHSRGTMLPISFTISSWVWSHEITAEKAWFYKKIEISQEYFEYLYIFVDASKKLNVRITTQPDLTVSGTVTVTSFDVPEETWEFFAVSIEMSSDALNSQVGFLKGSAGTSYETHDFTGGVSFIDITNGGWNGIGIHFHPTTLAEQHSWDGFIYNFHLMHGVAEGMDIPYGNSGCDASCLTNSKCTVDPTECLEPTEPYSCVDQRGDADCWLCYDPMCISCSETFSADQWDVCHDLTSINNNECSTCHVGTRTNSKERCFGCYDGCDSCFGTDNYDGDMMTYCTTCAADKKDINADGDIYYCYDSCPTQFTDNGSSCTKDLDLILSYNFNVPQMSFSNSVSGPSIDIVAEGGDPAIHRGYHIGTNAAYISFSNVGLVLNSSWSVHAWIFQQTAAGSGAVNTVFSKDKYDSDGTPSEQFIRCGISENLNLTIEWVRDGSMNFRKETLDKQITNQTWTYVVYSFEYYAEPMSWPFVQRTFLTGWVDNVTSSQAYFDHYFMLDKADYLAIIGNSRTSATTYENNLQGFIYELHIYQVEHSGTTSHYSSGQGCFDGTSATSCWTIPYGQHSTDGTTDDGSCKASCGTRGCRDSTECIASCGADDLDYCNLCHNALCTSCATYTQCSTCTTNAVISGDDCVCVDGYVAEPSGNETVCGSCFEECSECGASTTGNYSDCTECSSNSYEQKFNGGANTFCTDYCPTGFTVGTAPQCDAPSSATIASFTFTSNGPWVSGQTSIAETDNTIPKTISPLRGYYFGNSSAYLWFNVYVELPISFTISSWVWSHAITAEKAWFYQDTDVNLQQNEYLYIFVDASKKLNVRITTQPALTVSGTVTVTSFDVPEETWEFFAVSIEMLPDALNSQVGFLKGSAGMSYETHDFTGGVSFIDIINGGWNGIGIHFHPTSLAEQHSWDGFIYNFHLMHGVAGGTDIPYGNSNCDASCLTNSKCTVDPTECLEPTEPYSCVDQRGDADCWLCYDPMCISCSETFSADQWDVCHDLTSINNNECSTCHVGERTNSKERCFDCYDGCDSCFGTDNYDGDMMTYCTACATDKKNISGDGDVFYCVDSCPTQFTDNGSSCTKDLDLILSYNFNVPQVSFSNSVSQSISIDIEAEGGDPAIHRGYHIGANDAYISFSDVGLVLNSSWSVHAWIFQQTAAGSGAVNTVFSKDKYDSDGTPSQQFIRCGISENLNLTIEWVRDGSMNFRKETLDNQIVNQTWTYVVYSFEYHAEPISWPFVQRTFLTGWVDNVTSSQAYFDHYFMLDKEDYLAIIGNSRTSATTYENNLQGFIYELHIYQVEHSSGTTSHYTTGQGCVDGTTATSCWTIPYGQYTTDGTTDDGSCKATCGTRGCRDSSECIASCGVDEADYCNLCHNPLCTTCATYTQCSTCKSNSVIAGNDCVCVSGYVAEPSGNETVCNACFGECATCGASTTGNYSDCTACSGNKWEQTFNVGSYTWCADYCPTGYTQDAQPTCTEPISTNLQSWTFNTNTPWIGLSMTGSTPSPLRGLYHNTSTELSLDPQITLPINFTISSWIYLFSNSNTQSIFCKDDDTGGSSNTNYFHLYIHNGQLYVKLHPISDYNIVDTAIDTTADFPEATWEYWAVSVKMSNDALNSTIRFIKGVTDTEIDHTSTNNTHFLDLETGATFIGHSRDSDQVTQHVMHGLIYNFYIDRGFYSKGDIQLHYGNTGWDGSCSTDPCTEVITECLSPVEYYSCDWFGGDSDCWNCLDPMCMSCSTYTDDSCNTDMCHEFAPESSNGCVCIAAVSPRASPKSVRCFEPCQGECDTCSPQNDSSYGDLIVNCSACASGNRDIADATNYKFCIDACPTGTSDTDPTCADVSGSVISIDFVVPSTTFQSTGSASALQGDYSNQGNVSADEFYIVSSNGYPAAYRGYFIQTDTDYVSLLKIILNKEFAVHSWIKIDELATGGDSNTIFTKDKYGVSSQASTDFIRCAIDASKNLTVEMVRDGAQNFRKNVLDTAIDETKWSYVVYSFEFTADASSTPRTNYVTVTGYVNNVPSTPVIYDRFFINDKAEYNAYIGNTRTASSTWDNPLNGFIYEFHLYQQPHSGATTHYTSGQGCYDGHSANSCWIVALENYTLDGAVAVSCANPSCANGCKDSNTCVDNCGTAGNEPWCYLCPDKLCTECDTYAACNVGACAANASNDGNVCACDPGYIRVVDSSINEICVSCFGDCAACSVGEPTTPDYSVCTTCMVNTVNTVPDSSSYKFCETECPTNYTETSTQQCTTSDTFIAEISFNIVGINYTNSKTVESGHELTISSTQYDGSTSRSPNLWPAINRGVYFSGDTLYPGFVQISNLHFAPTFSIHAWVLRKSDAVQVAIFSKDKAFDTHFYGYIDAANKISLNANGCVQTAASKDITQDSWFYLVWSVEEQDGNSALVHAFVNNNNATYGTCTGNFVMRDLATYESYLGIRKTSLSPDYEDEFNGFIWELLLKQEKYQSASTIHFQTTSPCTSLAPCPVSGNDVTTDDWGYYNGDGSQCLASCDATGCRRSAECATTADCEASEGSTGEKYCNLCYDRECAKCSTYDDFCQVCNVSGNAAMSSTDCICSTGFGRPAGKQSYCKSCWTNCKSCDVSEQEHYNDCTACKDDTFDTTPSSNDVPGYTFCSGSCPTLWTCNTGVSPYTSTPPGSFELYAYYFAYTFPDSSMQWSNEVAGEESRKATLNDDNRPAGMIASYRGIYFNGNHSWVDLESTLVLNHDFSVYVWSYHQSITGQRVIFAKDRNPNLFLRFYTDGAVVKVDLAKDDDHTVSNTVDTTGQGEDLVLMSWAFLGFSAQLKLHKDTEIKIYKDAGLVTTGTISNIFVDDQATWGASIGIERSGVNTWDQNPFMGFIYEFHLWQAAIDGTSEHRATSGCGNSCVTCPKNHLEGICVWDTSDPDDLFEYFYNEETQAMEAWVSTSCDNIGCRRPMPCRNDCAGFDYCNMCYDYHCNECTTHKNAACASNCDGTHSSNCSAPNTDKCCCNNNFNDYPIVRSDEFYPCCAPGCEVCQEPAHYETCSECQANTFQQPGTAFHVCFDSCPTGFSEDTGNKLCTGSATQIINYDMSYITRPISNLESTYSALNGLAGNSIGSGGLFSDPLPYQLRGSYFNTNAAIQIPNVLVNHSFTILLWVRFDSVSGTQTIFSIDRNNYSGGITNCENSLNIQADADKISVGIYKHRTDMIGWETAESASATLSGVTWYYLAVSLDYDGKDTQVDVYIDGSALAMTDASLDEVYLEHKSGFNTILGCEAGMLNGGSPENALSGYIYTFKLNQTVLSGSDIADNYTTTNCIGPTSCTKCPLSNGKICLWEAVRNSFELTDGSEQLCDKDNSDSGDDCGTVGCRRREDCNLCFDRVCDACTNFDETDTFGADSCTSCMSNASFQGTAPVDTCKCNDDFFFNDLDSDQCDPCDPLCNICTYFGNKSCSECNASAFLQENSTTCLSFCPDGYTEDASTLICTNPPASSKVWDLYLSSWTLDFRTVYESTRQVPVTVGLTSNPTTYSTDRPWFKRSPEDRLSYLFGGDDALTIESPTSNANRAGIVFGHSFTLWVWVRIHNDTGIQVLFSKTDMTGGPTGTVADKFTFGFDSGSLFTQYVEYDSVSTSYIASSNVKTASADDTSPYSWMLVGVSFNWAAGQTDVNLTKNENSVQTATEAEQFTDILDPSNVKNIIGCQLDQSNSYGPINFFTGDIWEIFLVNSMQTGSEIYSGIDTTLLPVLDSCQIRDLYYDTTSEVCVTCNETFYDADAYIEVDENLCTSCTSALCTQCTGTGTFMCIKCKVRATLVDGQCVCNANSSDDGTGVCVCNQGYTEFVPGVCMECRTYLKANQVQFAQFESTYSSINVRFDVEISYGHLNSCADFILASTRAKFGSDYDCKWQENGTLLVITLGNGATIGSEKLEFNGEQMYTTETGCPHSFETIEPIISKVTGVNPKPTAIFQINDNISTQCSDLVLQGETQNIRSLDYIWILAVDGSSFTASQNLNSQYVTIPGSSLSDGQMSITLSVKFSPITGFSDSELESDTKTTTVTMSSDRQLDIRFANVDTFTLNKNSYNEFPIEIVSDSCNSSTSFLYQWSLVSGPTENIGTILQDSYLLSKLVVRRQQLNTYGTYTFLVIASDADISGEKLLNLTLAAPELVASLNIPNGEQSVSNTLNLDASASYDPDDATTSLSFLWSCTNNSGNACVNQSGAVIFDTTSVDAAQTIAANTLVANSTYTFSVSVTADTRVASKSATITTLSYDAPALYITDQIVRVTASKPLRIQTQAEATSEVTFIWEQSSGTTIASSKILTPLTLPYISFAEDTFSEGADYTFTLRASYVTSSVSATVTFSINKAPKWGTFFCNLSSGVELVDIFELKALDWKDPEETDYPLKYSYKYTDEDGVDVDLRKPAADATFQTKLPRLTSNSNVNLTLCVFDSLDATTSTSTSVTVTPQDDDTRASTISLIIENLTSSQLDDRAGQINSIPTDFALTDSQYNKILIAIQDWVTNNTDDSQIVTTTAISMFSHITKFSQATTNSAVLLQAAKSIVQTSPDGITRDQSQVILASVERISTEANDIDSVINEIRTAAFSQTLAEEESFDYSSENLGVTIQRTTPKRISGQSFTPFGSSSTVTLPSTGLLDTINKQASDESTIIDTELTEYPKLLSDTGASSSVLDFTMVEVGYYTGSDLVYHDNPIELQTQNLSEEVVIQIAVENMPDDFNPQCVYASAYDETTKETTWSTDGVVLQEVKPAEGLVICKSTHLTRFTANENMVSTEVAPEIEVITQKDDSEDDKESDIFPVMSGAAGFLVFVIVIVSLADRRHKEKSERRTATNDGNSSGFYRDVTSPASAGTANTDRDQATTRRADTYFAESRKLARAMANAEVPVNALTPVKSIDPEGQPKFLDRYDNLFYVRPKPSIDSPESPVKGTMETEGPVTANRLEDLVPIKVNKISMLSAHLIFGGCRKIPYSKTVRTSVFCTALLGEMALFGAALFYFEGDDVFGSYNPDDPQPDYEIYREGVLAGISVGIQLLVSIIMVFLYSRQSKLATFTNIVLIFAYVAAIVGMSIYYTKYWSMIWAVGSGVAAVIEILLAQTVLMVFIYCINR